MRDLPRLRSVFPTVALWCERRDLQRPDLWWRAVDQDDVPEDVRWVAESPHISMLAIPDTPAASRDDQMATAWLTHEAVGGTVDHSLNGLAEILRSELAAGHLPDHIDKLLAHPDVEERHLFLVIHESALTFELSDALATGRTMPLEPPPLPHGVTHLWLAHHFSRRVLLGAAGGWSEHSPYDG